MGTWRTTFVRPKNYGNSFHSVGVKKKLKGNHQNNSDTTPRIRTISVVLSTQRDVYIGALSWWIYEMLPKFINFGNISYISTSFYLENRSSEREFRFLRVSFPWIKKYVNLIIIMGPLVSLEKLACRWTQIRQKSVFCFFHLSDQWFPTFLNTQ